MTTAIKDKTITLWERMKEEFAAELESGSLIYRTVPGGWHEFRIPRIKTKWYHYLMSDHKQLSMQFGEPYRFNVLKTWYNAHKGRIDGVISAFTRDSGYKVDVTLAGEYGI